MSEYDTLIPGYIRFAFAGLAGGGASFTSHPFDLVKYRMQLSGKGGSEKLYKNTLHALYKITTKEGILAVYAGLSASILRQVMLTTVRVGMYSTIVDSLTATDGTPPSIYVQVTAGLVCGALGAVVANPADLALVRMASNASFGVKERYNYKNCFHAISSIHKEEGMKGFFIGMRPAVYRMMVLNVCQVVLYKNSKVFLLRTDHFHDNTELHVLCSVISALVASFATAPFDVVKTRLMTTKKGDKDEYNSLVNGWRQIIKHEGIFALWKGVTPTFGRILPHNFTVFILLEFFTKSYKKYVLGDKSGTGF